MTSGCGDKGEAMFAIIETGGKQYRVQEGDVVRVEKLAAEPGDVVTLPVMMLAGDEVKVGTPHLEGASVEAEVLTHGRGEKLYVRKFKAKVNYRRTQGHRQPYTDVRITRIA
jgi:large subunit ribosomal protein L21